ncbi:hypothetical protein M409DRAFT_54090 [Zasmidium cellare ATCC 36951]|uniref:BZIP domain-containing protein n=1 Tax=Zasmidium cellare ATCC 36951 TaxID=1080233 RepID=A0A6A6CKC6_ZASCE|nr:uncharacterized protein M409DRAFT_54090 [Zasmidium cellare ATCC 36951]KAF2167491.1 hypothetical protein M409DRAFT_54090 [Zasmidium cellare ATCC 36951]
MSVASDLQIEGYTQGTGKFDQGQDIGYEDRTIAYMSPYTYPGSSLEDWPWSYPDGFAQATSSTWNDDQELDNSTPEEVATSTHSNSPSFDPPGSQSVLTQSEKTAKQLRRKAQNRESQRNFRRRKEQSLRQANETIVQLQNQSKDQQREIVRSTGLLQQTRIEVQTLRSILTPRMAESSGGADFYDNTWATGKPLT